MGKLTCLPDIWLPRLQIKFLMFDIVWFCLLCCFAFSLIMPSQQSRHRNRADCSIVACVVQLLKRTTNWVICCSDFLVINVDISRLNSWKSVDSYLDSSDVRFLTYCYHNVHRIPHVLFVVHIHMVVSVFSWLLRFSHPHPPTYSVISLLLTLYSFCWPDHWQDLRRGMSTNKSNPNYPSHGPSITQWHPQRCHEVTAIGGTELARDDWKMQSIHTVQKPAITSTVWVSRRLWPKYVLCVVEWVLVTFADRKWGLRWQMGI